MLRDYVNNYCFFFQNIHPFYADLINVLYDRDHYKLALGQLNVARNLIENVGKDYVKLLKFGDSLYRCKMLKRAALGRMCTVLKKQTSTLAYLEQVRQHLARLPSIDPNTRTLLLTGYPNVGKSSFINKITRADVEVQPYAFTTKSLFVGHMDYKYVRWQVIDTPGILDHPLEDRNTIEMQAVTALAHLNCVVLFFVDISGQSDYTIEQQVSLFKNIHPLFAKKPVVVVANKTDVRTFEMLDAEEQNLINSICIGRNLPLIPMSNISEVGVHDTKSKACDLLLEQRVQVKLQSNKVDSIMSRIHVAVPKKRDNKERGATIPESVVIERQMEKEKAADMDVDALEENPEVVKLTKYKRRTLKDVEEENGGAGVFSFDHREHWQLEKEEWKHDDIPEIFLGKNVLDYYDADIMERLEALENEEAQIVAELERKRADDLENGEESESELDSDHEDLAKKIREKKAIMKIESSVKKSMNKPPMPRKFRRDFTAEVFKKHLEKLGLDGSAAVKSASTAFAAATNSTGMDTDEGVPPEESRGRGRNTEMTSGGARLRGRSKTTKVLGKRRERDNDMEVDSDEGSRDLSVRLQSAIARARSGVSVRSQSCFRDESQRKLAEKLKHKKQRTMSREARKGEGDRHIPTLMPKHLYSGKRGIGKTDRR